MADCKVVDPPIDWELIEKWSSTSMKGKGSYSTARKLCFAATIYNLWLQRNYLLVGGRVEGQGVLRFERWCQFAFFGVFGRREILGVSKT